MLYRADKARWQQQFIQYLMLDFPADEVGPTSRRAIALYELSSSIESAGSTCFDLSISLGSGG